MRLAAQVKKVLVLAYDDPGFVERPRPESPVVEQVEPTLEDVFGVMSAVAEPNGPRKEATGYRPETSCDLNDDMIRLLRGVGDGGQDVFPLETGIVGEDFVDGGPVGEEFQHVRHADAHAPDAGLSAALSGLDGDAWMDCGRHGLSIPRIHGQSRASKADETVPAAPSPRSGYVRPPAEFPLRRILRRLATPSLGFPLEKAIVRDPTRGVFFAGRRTGSHGAAPSAHPAKTCPLRRHPDGLSLAPA